MICSVWILAVITLALTSGHFPRVSGTKANCCDSSIIDKIKELWACQGYEQGYPSNIIQTLKDLGYLNTLRQTDHYLDNQDEISCIFFLFSDTGFSAFNQQYNGSLVGAYRDAWEENGIVHNPENGDKNYMIFVNDRGVLAWYKCNDEGSKGDPEGGISVAKVFSPDTACKIEQTLHDLGIIVSHQFNLGCGPCRPSCYSPV